MTEKSKEFWIEDNMYGRYEVSLTIDVGTVDAALEVMRLFRAWLEEVDPPRFGHLTKFVKVNGFEEKRV